MTIFFHFFIVCEIFCICIAVAMCDKVHHVETIHIHFKQHMKIFGNMSDDWETLLNRSFPCIIRN